MKPVQRAEYMLYVPPEAGSFSFVICMYVCDEECQCQAVTARTSVLVSAEASESSYHQLSEYATTIRTSDK